MASFNVLNLAFFVPDGNFPMMIDMISRACCTVMMAVSTVGVTHNACVEAR